MSDIYHIILEVSATQISVGEFMQRTVHGTKVIYGVLDTDENGNICIAEREYKSTEKDENKAKKSFRKSHPDDAILRTEPFTDLYVLDDDIFFKYAKVVTDTDETTATDDQ